MLDPSEGAFLGTSVVNIGTRQDMRERGANVIDVMCNFGEIKNAIDHQLQAGKYNHQPIYGSGNAGKKIADILASISEIQVQKRITY